MKTSIARGFAADAWIAAALLALATAVSLILVSHSRGFSSLLEASEVALTWFAAPLVFLWVRQLVERPVRAPLAAALFAPALAWLSLGLAGVEWASHRDAIRLAVLAQIAGTAAAAIVWRRLGATLSTSRRRVILRGLIFLTIVHVAQVLRSVAPSRVPRDIVPAAAGLALVGLGFVALRPARSDVSDRSASRPAPQPDPRSERLLAALERLVVEERAFLDPSLTLASAAQRLDASVTALSRAINGGLGRSFPDYLTELRVEEACRLLRDSRLAALSVEGIGRRAGFGSRSRFFAAFRLRTGQSPAEFRAPS